VPVLEVGEVPLEITNSSAARAWTMSRDGGTMDWSVPQAPTRLLIRWSCKWCCACTSNSWAAILVLGSLPRSLGRSVHPRTLLCCDQEMFLSNVIVLLSSTSLPGSRVFIVLIFGDDYSMDTNVALLPSLSPPFLPLVVSFSNSRWNRGLLRFIRT